jgi:outer membrane protein assembly factor BamB
MRLFLMVTLASACGGFAWQLRPATTSGDDSMGAPLRLRSEGDILYVLGDKGLSALKSGARSWSVPLTATAMAVSEGRVVVTGGGRVAAYKEGAQLWELPAERTSPPVIGGGKVVLVANNLLMALDLDSGKMAWKAPIAVDNALMRAMPFARVAPAIAAGKVCAGLAWEFNVVDLASGEKGAHEDATGGGVSASLAADGERCFFPQSRNPGGGFAAGSNLVTAVDPRAAKFAVLWQRRVGDDDRDGGIAGLALAGATLFVATNFRVLGIDQASGAVKWMRKGAPVATRHGTRAVKSGAFAFDVERGVVANDAPGSNFTAGDGRLFVTAADGAHDVVTMLDANSGAYLGSFDPAAEVRDLAVADHQLWMATSAGLRSAKIE